MTRRAHCFRILFALVFCLVATGVNTAAAVPVLFGLTNASGTGGGGGSGGGTGNDAGSEFVVVNQTSGSLTSVGSVGFGRASGLAFDPTTQTMYATGGSTTFNPFRFNTNLLTIDIATGAGTAVGPTGHEDPPINATGNVTDLARRPDGTLFGYSPTTTLDVLMTLDTGTGAATQVGTTSLGDDGQGNLGGNGMTFSAGVLLHANDFFLNELNDLTGATISSTALDYSSPFFDVTNPDLFPRVSAMAVHPLSGAIFTSVTIGGRPSGFAGTSPASFLAILDPDNGTFSYLGPASAKLDALEFVDLPEPSTFLLLGLGLAGLGFGRRRATGSP